ncbi:DUF308 domain-containing protein [Streptomyces sp. ALI-76-A]|uniref:DUF308 domain-containing protein n=1 Tax=Streptomyces sp. ALI-76-A TaxID=3025736 RepID=UPI0033652510
MLVGVCLAINGVFQLIAAFGTRRTNAPRVLVLVLVSETVSLLRGLFPPSPTGRCPRILSGIVTFAGCVVLIEAPFESVAVLTLAGGGRLVVGGAAETATALRVRGRARQVPHPV